MAFTVLSDAQVNQICESLDQDELDDFRRTLGSALHDFSTDPKAGALYQQPHRVTTFHASTEATTLYMPSTGPDGIGCKVVSLTASKPKDPSLPVISPTGIVNLFQPDGTPSALIHATTLTAFRTALSSNCLVFRRNHVRTIVVFGSGLQAYWHVRLALMCRGSGIKNVHVINHRFSDSAKRLMKKFAHVPQEVKEREGWFKTQFSILTPAYGEYKRLLKDYIRSADVIFCCTPSTEPLFDGAFLTNPEGRKKGRLIVAVGSYRPEMRELPEGLVLQAVKKHESGHRHFHRHADEGGVIVVDTLEGVLKEAGEIISAKVEPNQLVELGELVMLRRLALEEDASASESASVVSSNDPDSTSIDLTSASTSSMSTVFGSSKSEDSTKRDRRGSSGSTGSNSGRKSPSMFHLPFRQSSSTKASSNASEKDSWQEKTLCRWLRDGTVVYKSVGLGLMDLVVGTKIVEVAQEKQIGTRIEDF